MRMEINNSSSLVNALIILVLTTSINGELKCTSPKNIREIECFGDGVVVLRRGMVSDKAEVVKIILRACTLDDIEVEAFRGDPHLEDIDLSYNFLRTLRDGVFQENVNLKHLNLSFNIIENLSGMISKNYSNLETLDLKGNHLKYLNESIFYTMTNLRYLDLSSNYILGQQLTAFLFAVPMKIKFLDFSKNNMDETPTPLLSTLHEIETLKLDRCSLKKVPVFATSKLKTLKNLIMSNNIITNLFHLYVFDGVPNLEALNLANNALDEIYEKVFHPLQKIRSIVMRNNKLTAIPEKLFENLQALGNIDLANNLIEYIPLDAFRQTPALKNLNLSKNKFTYLESNFLLELRNSGVALSKFYFHNNPWQCACLTELLTEAKSFNVYYMSSKYNGGSAVCVTEEFNCKRQKADNDYFINMYNREILGRH